ncbi:MAG: hypothetical protein AB1716_21275 [Planctomycetota bacterium]
MRRKALLVVALAALCAAANADFVTGFEDYNAAPGGVMLTGQQGWYDPDPNTTVPYDVYTYTGNAFNFPQNPLGGNNFIAGRAPGGTPVRYNRGQHAHNFGTGNLWLFSFDQCAQFNGAGAAQDYLGSFSQQPSATARYTQTLNIWNDNNNPTSYRTQYVTQANNVPGIAPGPEWQNLQPNHWYRLTTLIDFNSLAIIEVSIRDLTAGTAPAVVQPTGWQLRNGTGPMPTDIRFFTGGAGGGNTMAWDNLSIVPEPACLLCLGLLALLRRR